MHSRAHIITSIFMGRHNLIHVPEVHSPHLQRVVQNNVLIKELHTQYPMRTKFSGARKSEQHLLQKKFHLHYCNDVGEDAIANDE